MVHTKEQLLKVVSDFIDGLRDNQMVTASQIMEMVGISKPTFTKLSKDPTFPKPLIFGKKLRRWPLKEVMAWINDKKIA